MILFDKSLFDKHYQHKEKEERGSGGWMKDDWMAELCIHSFQVEEIKLVQMNSHRNHTKSNSLDRTAHLGTLQELDDTPCIAPELSIFYEWIWRKTCA